MNIGIFKTNTQGALVGNLPSLHLKDVSFEGIEKKGNGPDYRITLDGAELGAAWKKTSKEGNKPYLSAQIDSPLFPAVIYFAVFPKDGFSVAVWDRKPAEQE